MTVVYCTSTTAFNTRFIPLREIASKALPLPSVLGSLIALNFAFLTQTQRFATAVEDTRPNSASFITFLAPLHLFCACTCFSTFPYTCLDASERNMLPVLHSAFCCTLSAFLHSWFFLNLELKGLNPVDKVLSSL